MTTNTDVFQAGVDAVIADNTLNQNGFENACQTVSTRITNAEADAWVNALIAEYHRLGIINNATYANFRNQIITEGANTALVLFEALAATINGLSETNVVNADIRRSDLIVERDEVDTSIATMQNFRTGATPQVKDALNLGISQLRGFKETLRDELRNLGENN